MTVYIQVPKAKRMKLEPSGKKDTIVGYKMFHMEIDCEEQDGSEGRLYRSL